MVCAKIAARPRRLADAHHFLGYVSVRTSVAAYAGIDCRRAARRHQHLVEQALAAQTPTRRSNRRQREVLDEGSMTDR
jgi:hypothetical protein